ncbi:hypothetical protein EGW08_012226 [Elysia chlorotica]|uniref:Uncharacterized protein n=1 Tax=Elysia chlorotica TaxID=188477 RepID=A0A433TEM6_ELYCH|nr:hypothetical protein EGW08_012226 [Elysia chlorotica]
MANDGSTAFRSALSASSGAIRRLTRSKSKQKAGLAECPPASALGYPVNGGGGNGYGGGAADTRKSGARPTRSRSWSIFRWSGKRASSNSAVSLSISSAAGLRDSETNQGEEAAKDRRHTFSFPKRQHHQQHPLQPEPEPVAPPTAQSIRQLMDPEQSVPVSPVSMRRHHSVPRQHRRQEQRPTLRHLAQDVIVLATNGILATPPASMFRAPGGHSPASLSPSGSPYSDRPGAAGFRVSPKTSPRQAKRGFYGSPSLSSPKIRRGSPKHSPNIRRGSPKHSPKTVKAGLCLTLSTQGEKLLCGLSVKKNRS